MTDPEAVRDALARLAREDREPPLHRRHPNVRPCRTTGTTDRPEDPEAVVERAVAATDDVERAAAFLAHQDLASLEAAVAALHERGEDAAAERGQRVLDSFRRFRDACEADS